MSYYDFEDGCKCPKCQLVNKYLDRFKMINNEDELEFCLRQLVNKSFDMGYKEMLLSDLDVKIDLLHEIEEIESDEDLLEEDEDKPNLHVVDNVNNKLN